MRQWPEFFKPKDLFSAMGENKAQEDAEKLLQFFETENNTIHCTDGSALQALIPYVKRELQLFHQIKENTKRVLSPDDVRNGFYQCETRRYINRLTEAHWNLLLMLRVLDNFKKVPNRMLCIYRWLMWTDGQGYSRYSRVFKRPVV